MSKNITVLYHRDADGFGAAYAMWLVHGDSANYISVQYGEPVPEIPASTEELAIVDFSYDRITCMQLARKYNLVVIDHHKTAEAELKDCPFAVFDMNKSGAVLTFEYLFGTNEEVPLILQYVQDRDLWKFELEDSKEVNAYIASLPEEFEIWHRFDYNVAYKCGHAIQRVLDRQVEAATRRLCTTHMDGHRAALINNTVNISEACDRILKDNPDVAVAASWFIQPDGTLVCSLRSRGDVDVSEIAKRRGGGGHKSAAGYTLPGGGSWILSSLPIRPTE